MVMATTVPPVRLLSNTLRWLLPCLVMGCQPRMAVELPTLPYQNIASYSRRGLLYVSDSVFSGSIFGLYPHTTDTSFIRSYWQGKEHGCWKKYYPDGQLQEIRYYNRGKKEEQYQAWWPNGIRRLDYHFADGEYDGNCREWNIRGVLIKEMNYQQGYEAGRQRLWYGNGKIKSNYVMRNGRRYGLLGTKNCTNVTDSIF